jgi:hypothetical protein
VDKLADDARSVTAAMSGLQRSLYAASFDGMVARALARERAGSPPEDVAEVVRRAVRSPRPRARYLVGRDARRLAVIAVLPTRLRNAVLRRVTGLPAPGSLAVPITGRPAVPVRAGGTAA